MMNWGLLAKGGRLMEGGSLVVKDGVCWSQAIAQERRYPHQRQRRVSSQPRILHPRQSHPMMET